MAAEAGEDKEKRVKEGERRTKLHEEKGKRERDRNGRVEAALRNLLGLSTDLIGFLVENWPRGKQQRVLILLRDKSNKSSTSSRHTPRIHFPFPPLIRELSDGDKLNRDPSTTGFFPLPPPLFYLIVRRRIHKKHKPAHGEG